MTDDKNDLTISRLIGAPRPLVWKAWSQPEHLEKWWCPKPWRAEIRAFDLRPGGAFDTLMHGPEGEENPTVAAFLEVLPAERIVFTTALIAGWRPAVPWLALTAIITMQDEGEGTRYSAVVMHKDAEDRRKHEEMGFHEGWGTGIEQLGAYVASLK